MPVGPALGAEEDSVFPSYNCFGCSPRNERGLRLRFEDVGAGVRAMVELGEDYESFPTTIHGGIVAAVLDEAMGRAVYRTTGGPGVTVGLRVRFIAPVRTGTRYRVDARVVSRDEERLKMRAELSDEDDAPMAAADATFVAVDESHFELPDREGDDR